MLKKIPLLLFCLPFLLPADTPAKYQRKYPRTVDIFPGAVSL